MARSLFPEVTVNGDVISAADIAAEAQNHDAPKGKPGLAWRKAARALVVRKLMLEQAKSRQIDAAPREVAPGKFETGEEAQIRAVMEEAVVPEVAPEAALRSAYDGDPERFRAPSLFEPAHILLAASPQDTEALDGAMKKAAAILELLEKTPNQFDRLAKDNSDCPSREAGGRLGQIGSGDTVPEFEAALLELEPGAIASHPVLSRFGVHIIRLDAKALGAVLPYDAVRTRIAEAYEKAAWARAAKAFVEELISTAEVTGLALEKVE